MKDTMKKKLVALFLTAAAVLLCGCGSVFDKEYVAISDYNPPVQNNTAREDKITVRNLSELKAALLSLVSAGESEGAILFDTDYDGDATADMASACWQVRTQDALCAYCVDNIAYDLSKIVTHYEAEIDIRYSPAAVEAGSIRQMQYSTGIEEVIRSALEEGSGRLVVLITRSFYSAEEMESLVGRVYRTYPASTPREPQAKVSMFSGSGRQRLYEIHLDYGMSAAELELRRERLRALQPFADEDTDSMSQAEKALLACEYLAEHCSYTATSQDSDVYAALVRGSADSEGMALAYVELCRQLSVPCQIVYGQRSRENHCWNIVELDGAYYHVDSSICASVGTESGFLLRDEEAWVNYRWDMSAYPACSGQLRYPDFLSQEEEAENTEEIENEA